MSQLALPLRLADHAIFDTFLAAGNEPLVDYLQSLTHAAPGQGAWIWGASATGKTHLLQATCERFGDRAAYVPLAELAELAGAGPGLLEGLESRQLVCIDDLDSVAGDEAWERALFVLCNDVSEAGHHLVVSAMSAPRESAIALADLRSRLQRLATFHLRELADAGRVAALQLRARHRGLELPDDTARYLMARSRRDMRSLYELLDKLDLEALRAQRRLTIPFVKDVLQSV
ncbi:MAG: DnaA regulatory inactivator Hda [Deltaproteobacteria bacterium]|nr:DnaA regulatory inactivator Hda [Deltaproteobacteria bacterium]